MPALLRRPSDQLRGNGIGAIVIAGMGSVWMVIALRHQMLPLAFILLLPLFLVVWGLKLIRASTCLRDREAPQTASQIAAESALQKRFVWIFAGEGIAIFLAVNVLANLGQSAFLLPTIGVIVGLHFLPLARLYGRLLFYWSGGIQILICLLAAVTLRSDLNVLNTTTGVAMGVTLWITMFAVLIRSREFLQ